MTFVPNEHSKAQAYDDLALTPEEVATLAGLRSGEMVAVPRERFEHWLEYWNKDRNETAMADALDFLEGEFSEVLAAAPAPKGGEDG